MRYKQRRPSPKEREIMVTLTKFIAWKGLNPHPLLTSHLRILMYLENLERKKFI